MFVGNTTLWEGLNCHVHRLILFVCKYGIEVDERKSCRSWCVLGLLLQRPESWRVWTRTQTLVRTSTNLHVVVGSASIQFLNLRPRGTNFERCRKNCWYSWEVCGNRSAILILSKCYTCICLCTQLRWIFCMNPFSTHRIWSSYSGDAEVSGLLGCDTLSVVESFFDILEGHSDFLLQCRSVLDWRWKCYISCTCWEPLTILLHSRGLK